MISIDDLNIAIKQVLDDKAEVMNFSQVYETPEDASDSLRLVIFFNKMYFKETSVLYTKLIFLVNTEKTELKENNFLYLFDINCMYKKITFTEIEDFKKKFVDILEKDKFGPDIKVLSKFIESPSASINDWFYKNDIQDLSVLNFTYEPKIYIMPCKSLSFTFNIKTTKGDTELVVKKEGKNDYFLDFILDHEEKKTNVIHKQMSNLNTFVQTIAEVLKNNMR